MGNRVEDLETQVAELQAAVDGLTEELVETKERISQLESARDVADADPGTDSHAEFVPNASATAEAAEDASPDAAERAAEEADGSEAADADEETEESDDIIVA
ncbi:DUF7518 family protein [Halorarum salinum]|uniref:Chromosome segregation protein SMC n=1 Tax=Halorarum salinum TaxID=2743089 RepID=A0A7D5LBR6_9EURY|nr:chromosome segregation protein SMC [Halobaculum salinum]QLG62973.1 chromosome segregation protein SMC [Halobaculum salinum]